MGERAPGLDAPSADGGAETTAASPREASRQLEGDIAALREELGTLVGELDRRRHELVDVKLQLKRHAGGAALTGVSLVAAAAGVVWLRTWQARRRAHPLARAGRLGEAVSRMVERPERVAAELSVSGKILTAAATAAVATLVKRGIEWLVHAALSSPAGESARRHQAGEPESWATRRDGDAWGPGATPGAATGTSAASAGHSAHSV
jgi:hypothetical protein